MENVLHNIPPVFDKNSRVLILGSFPSVKSRESAFFYAHPSNRFWKVLAAVFSKPVPMGIDGKKAFLLNNNIALWDVIAQCSVEGSADSSIKNAVPNDIDVILNSAGIRQIFVNGKTAEKYYNAYLYPKTGIKAVCLPSTSPANAAKKLDRLIEEWRLVSFGMLPHRVVGEREKTADYYERPGAYIIPVKNGKIGLVKSGGAYNLIGGGREKGETNPETLLREVKEETGYGVKTGTCFATAEQFKPDQTDIGYFHPYQYYYTGELTEKLCEPVEKDHFLEWLAPEEALGKPWLEMQSWALEIFLKEYNSRGTV